MDLLPAIHRCSERLAREPDHHETAEAVHQALDLADAVSRPTPEHVEQLGQGWTGEEALAISLFCALKAEDFAHGVLLAVNHGGDSDSTGSITGNILGLMNGEASLPQAWLDRLELREVIADMADALWKSRAA